MWLFKWYSNYSIIILNNLSILEVKKIIFFGRDKLGNAIYAQSVGLTKNIALLTKIPLSNKAGRVGSYKPQ